MEKCKSALQLTVQIYLSHHPKGEGLVHLLIDMLRDHHYEHCLGDILKIVPVSPPLRTITIHVDMASLTYLLRISDPFTLSTIFAYNGFVYTSHSIGAMMEYTYNKDIDHSSKGRPSLDVISW
jgi:hypothetical protein